MRSTHDSPCNDWIYYWLYSEITIMVGSEGIIMPVDAEVHLLTPLLQSMILFCRGYMVALRAGAALSSLTISVSWIQMVVRDLSHFRKASRRFLVGSISRVLGSWGWATLAIGLLSWKIVILIQFNFTWLHLELSPMLLSGSYFSMKLFVLASKRTYKL